MSIGRFGGQGLAALGDRDGKLHGGIVSQIRCREG